jgi:hypothetical protein
MNVTTATAHKEGYGILLELHPKVSDVTDPSRHAFALEGRITPIALIAARTGRGYNVGTGFR